MRKGLIDRVLEFMGFGDVSDEEDGDDDERQESSSRRRHARAVAALPSPPRAKLVVAEPRSFEDIPGILDHLKKHRPVIISVSEIDRGLARRVLDFAGGAAYALDGTMQKVRDGIFLFTPSGFEVGLDVPAGAEVAAAASAGIFDQR